MSSAAPDSAITQDDHGAARGCLHPWAALEGHVERKISEARRCVRVLKPSDRETAAAYLHWHGQLVALVKLRRNFKRWKEAPPNDQTQRLP